MSKRTPLSFNIEKVTPAPVTPIRKTGLPANTQAGQQENNTESKLTNDQTTKRANTKAKKAGQGVNFSLRMSCQKPPNSSNCWQYSGIRRLKSMLVEAINDLFAKHGLSRIAD